MSEENAAGIFSAGNISGIGIDIIEILRIKDAIEKNPGFLNRIYSVEEIKYCTMKKNPEVRYICFAQRFAAKEAAAKALGTGLGKYFSFKEISVENGPDGKPCIVLAGKAKKYCRKNNIISFHLSLSATKKNAIAFAIAFS